MFIVIVSLCFYQTLTTSQLQFRLVSLDNLPHFFLNIVHTNFVHSHLVIIFILLFIYVLPARVYLVLFLLVVCSLFFNIFSSYFFFCVMPFVFRCQLLCRAIDKYYVVFPIAPPRGNVACSLPLLWLLSKALLGGSFLYPQHVQSVSVVV